MSAKPLTSKPLKKLTFAEQMADSIRESILSGELISRAALPTEPELAEQFGVSRAVVRDATRILMAQGLVEVQHGRGVFVTRPDNQAFGEALLLALRRVAATAWDVEQFEQIVFPEIVALASSAASDEEIAEIHRLAQEFDSVVSAYYTKWWDEPAPAAENARFKDAYYEVLEAIFAATHNQVFKQLARPLLNLRNLRSWAETESSSPQAMSAAESAHIHQLVEAIAGRDPAAARRTVHRLMQLPPEAINAMRQTAVGEVTVIPVPLPGLSESI